MKSSNIIHLNPQFKTLESQLAEFKILDQQIKALTAQRDAIKKELTGGYFRTHDSYTNDNGQLLATYKEQIRTTFNQKLFQEERPELYENYLDLKSIRTFIVK